MKKHVMSTTIPADVYKGNIGAHAEAHFVYELTGRMVKLSNVKGGTDCLRWQVKSYRATVCHGVDVNNVLTEYATAERFAFVDSERGVWYDMSPAEFMDFARAFTESDRESSKNGGGEKLRLNRKFVKQREYLEARSAD